MGRRWSERYLETVNPWNRSTPRSSLRTSSAMTHRLFSGSIKLLDLKYAHIFDVSVARLTVGSPTNRANNGEHRYGFCKPPADFLAAFSLRSVSSPAASIGTYAEISRWYRSLSCSAIFSYPVRVSGSMLFHCSPSILAMSANFM